MGINSAPNDGTVIADKQTIRDHGYKIVQQTWHPVSLLLIIQEIRKLQFSSMLSQWFLHRQQKRPERNSVPKISPHFLSSEMEALFCSTNNGVCLSGTQHCLPYLLLLPTGRQCSANECNRWTTKLHAQLLRKNKHLQVLCFPHFPYLPLHLCNYKEIQ